MPDILTPEEVAECRERAERATDGPWVVRTAPHPDSGETKAEYMASLVTDDCGSLFVIIPESDDDLPVEKRYRVTSIVGDAEQSPPNARFIAHARTDIPALCATVEALREENERLREALLQIVGLPDAHARSLEIAVDALAALEARDE